MTRHTFRESIELEKSMTMSSTLSSNLSHRRQIFLQWLSHTHISDSSGCPTLCYRGCPILLLMFDLHSYIWFQWLPYTPTSGYNGCPTLTHIVPVIALHDLHSYICSETFKRVLFLFHVEKRARAFFFFFLI